MNDRNKIMSQVVKNLAANSFSISGDANENADRTIKATKQLYYHLFNKRFAGVEDANLVTTDRYIIGVNTVGQSLKNPSYDLRSAPACPKFVVSPFLNSTIEPDFNIKSLE